MTTEQPTERSPKVFRSVKQIKKHYLPKAYEREQLEKKRQDPRSLGASLAQEFLDKIRRELEKYR